MKAALAIALMLLAPGIAWAQDAPVPKTHYLPPDFAPNKDGFLEGWFGKHLASMGEPVLWAPHALDGYRSRFRMLVLPSFSQPYVIRIDQRADGRALIHYTLTNGRGGYGPGVAIRRKTRALDADRFARVTDALAAARFTARLPDNGGGQEFADAPRDEGMAICMDGTQLVFELLDAAGDHVVTRHECTLDVQTRALVAAMLNAADIVPDGKRGDPMP
ncbi:hypothetical protein [Sphingomonas sp. 67-41]|nr:hypothetical protein [Sphingomonas sp. 67-41]MBN8810325.1 hypothetical protein [Sphingomonas sp.]OJY50871.1 MAG: hypothetical protein BGP17_21015 [Sphingomonas sp. 67-41]